MSGQRVQVGTGDKVGPDAGVRSKGRRECSDKLSEVEV